MNTIYLNQKVILNATDLQDRDMDTITFTVEYWAPSNQTDIPTGTIDPAQISTTPGSPDVEIIVLKDILTEPSDGNRLWRFQIMETVTQICWTPMCFSVKNRGQQ